MPTFAVLSLLLLLFSKASGFIASFRHSALLSSTSSVLSLASASDDSPTLEQRVTQPKDFQIRAAERRDVEFISKLITTELSESGFNQEDVVPLWRMPAFLIEESAARIQIYERLEHWVGKRDHLMQVAVSRESSDILLGYIELGMSAVSNEAALLKNNVPMIGNLVVTRENRGKGIASALLAAAEQKAKEWGYEDIAVTVMDANTIALNLYNKCGYRKLAEVDTSFCDKPGRFVLIKPLASLVTTT